MSEKLNMKCLANCGYKCWALGPAENGSCKYLNVCYCSLFSACLEMRQESRGATLANEGIRWVCAGHGVLNGNTCCRQGSAREDHSGLD